MARTKASVGAKVASGKSSKVRCSAAPSSSASSSSGSVDRSARGGAGGGNSVCPRETPKWQKPITNFFVCKDTSRGSDSEDETAASSSKPKLKKQVIESDDEGIEVEKPINRVLDESLEFEPLTASSSKPKPKKQVIESDDEEVEVEKPINRVLDETLELEPLTGEDSHKIEEYYPKDGVKGKGKGKKTKDKENVDTNVERRNSVKRDLEEITFGEESEHVSKRIRVN